MRDYIKMKLVTVFFLTMLFLGGTTINRVMAAGEIIPSYPSEVNFKFADKTVGEIFSDLLPYIYVIAGLILLFMLIFGGIGLMTAAGDPKKMEASQKRITMALVGFLIVFVAYFVVQLMEVMLGADLGIGGDSTNTNQQSDGSCERFSASDCPDNCYLDDVGNCYTKKAKGEECGEYFECYTDRCNENKVCDDDDCGEVYTKCENNILIKCEEKSSGVIDKTSKNCGVKVCNSEASTCDDNTSINQQSENSNTDQLESAEIEMNKDLEESIDPFLTYYSDECRNNDEDEIHAICREIFSKIMSDLVSAKVELVTSSGDLIDLSEEIINVKPETKQDIIDFYDEYVPKG